MIPMYPLLRVSLNLGPCKGTDTAWQRQSGGPKKADVGQVWAGIPCSTDSVNVLYVLTLGKICTMYREFPKCAKNVLKRYGIDVAYTLTGWLPESG